MSYSLSAKSRHEKGEKVRSNAELPGVVYGAGLQTVSLTLSSKDFTKLFEEAGESSLIDLQVDGKPEGKVLVHDVQYNPVSERIAHVDLRRIDMNKQMKAMVQLRFLGEAPVVKEQGGTLMHTVAEVEVACLPQDLISHIDVDLASIVSFESTIRVADLKVSSGVKIISPSDGTIVAKAKRALTEEEIKAMEAAVAPVDLSKIELAKEKKVEEGEEGEGAEEGEEKEEKKESVKKEEKK